MSLTGGNHSQSRRKFNNNLYVCIKGYLQNYCLYFGANLNPMHNPEKNDFIQTFVLIETGHDEQAWISGSDAVRVMCKPETGLFFYLSNTLSSSSAF